MPLVLAGVPGWSGEVRLPLPGPGPAQIVATPVALDPADPARRRVGALTYLGGVVLSSNDASFGGYSALCVDRDRFTLLSDGGIAASFRLGADWRVRFARFTVVPAGPGNGWNKRDRDTESLVCDPATGQLWVGYEYYNMIWRYSAGFGRAEAQAAPPAMADWPDNGGPESLARLADGRFLVIGETAHAPHGHGRQALIYPGDPTAGGAPARFVYQNPRGTNPSDAAVLPDGSLVVLNRRFRLPYHFSVTITRVPRDELRNGGVAKGEVLATLDSPLLHDNIEGVAVTREGDATILWLVSDDNQSILQRTLLLKFRLAGA